MSHIPDGAFRASFRDPDGVLIAIDDRIVRAVRPAARSTLDTLLASDLGRQLVGSGRFVATKRLEGPPFEFASNPLGEAEATWYEHERIAIPTYAYEWSPRMLHAAAALTLCLARDGAAQGFGLKDATPDNILFRGAQPVFVDALSFERRDPHDPTWLPYAQFVRTFLLPLLANRELGLALDQALLTRRDGLEPDQVYRWSRWSQRLRSPFLSLVTLPTLLAGRAERMPTLYRGRREKNAGKAQFVLQGVFSQLSRALHAVTPAPRSSTWSRYDRQHDPDYVDRKTAAVATVLERWPRKRVLDIGCNTGQFSLLAARAGTKVVAVDADAVVVDTLWERAHQEGLDIQTLVGNLAQPSPATGWMNRERPSLIDRLRGRFDAVFALAVLHHFLATERVPLREVIDLFASVTTDLAVVEFVAPNDELFQRLSRGRDALYQHLTPDHFERNARIRFDVVERVTLMDGRRWLYVLRLPNESAVLTRVLACLGLANLMLLVEWQSLGAVYDRDLAYLENVRHPLSYLWSTAIAVLVIGAGFTVVSLLIDALRRWRRTRAMDRIAILLTGIVLVGVWLGATASLLSWQTRVRVGGALAVVALTCVVRLPRPSMLAAGSRLLASTAILFPIFLVSTLIRSMSYPLPALAQQAERQVVSIAANRVVWVVFDELDPTVAFDRRPSTLQMPNVDRLEAESFVATHAYAPGAWTLDAMPTLWTGRPVADARESGPSDLRLIFADGTGAHALADSPTVFSRVRSAGLNVGIAGWYHPYCRLFGAVAEPCEAASAGDANFAFRRAAFATRLGTLAMVPQLVSWHAPWSREATLSGGLSRARTVNEQSSMVPYRAEVYARVHRRSLEMARDPSLSLVFAHYPVPHLPGIYDRDRGELDVMESRSYLDNLALVDHTVGDLRRALEEAGLWATTTLLLHSDRALRPQVWRSLELWTPELEAATGGRQSALTPFVLKLAGQREPVGYEQPFSAALAHDLVLALLAGRLREPAEVKTWLDANRGRLPLSWHVTTLADR